MNSNMHCFRNISPVHYKRLLHETDVITSLNLHAVIQLLSSSFFEDDVKLFGNFHMKR